MKIIIALIENLSQRLDDALPYLLNLCIQELLSLKPKVAKNFQSMALQVVCMSLWYNSGLTFSILESNGWTFPVFHRLLILIPSLIHEFELRRFIFGLTAIVNTDPSTLPDLVRDRLPDIVQWLAKLCGLMEESRMKQVRDKERENGPPSYEGNQNNNGEYQDEEEYEDEDEESEGESAEINSRIMELKKAF